MGLTWTSRAGVPGGEEGHRYEGDQPEDDDDGFKAHNKKGGDALTRVRAPAGNGTARGTPSPSGPGPKRG